MRQRAVDELAVHVDVSAQDAAAKKAMDRLI